MNSRVPRTIGGVDGNCLNKCIGELHRIEVGDAALDVEVHESKVDAIGVS